MERNLSPAHRSCNSTRNRGCILQSYLGQFRTGVFESMPLVVRSPGTFLAAKNADARTLEFYRSDIVSEAAVDVCIQEIDRAWIDPETSHPESGVNHRRTRLSSIRGHRV